jgi:hypothetical protein
MKNFKLFNIVIGIIVILQSILLPGYMSPILFLLGLLNLFFGFGGLEWYQERKKKNKIKIK